MDLFSLQGEIKCTLRPYSILNHFLTPKRKLCKIIVYYASREKKVYFASVKFDVREK